MFPHPPGPFGYLEDIAVIEHGGGDSRLEWYRRGLHPRPQAVAEHVFDDGRRLEPEVGGTDVPGESYAIVYYDHRSGISRFVSPESPWTRRSARQSTNRCIRICSPS